MKHKLLTVIAVLGIAFADETVGTRQTAEKVKITILHFKINQFDF